MFVGLKVDCNTCIKLGNVYFPCYDSSAAYKADLGHCLGFIENCVTVQDSIVIMGDMNFECNDNSVGYSLCKEVFSNLNI